MEFQKIVHRAMDLRAQYERKETQLYGAPSTLADVAEGFAGDVANLGKLMAAERGERTIANSREKLEAHLAHCLWSVIVLSELQQVDLEKAFFEAMDRIENHLLESPE